MAEREKSDTFINNEKESRKNEPGTAWRKGVSRENTPTQSWFEILIYKRLVYLLISPNNSGYFVNIL